MNIGQKLKFLRKLSKKTQEEVARELGIPISTISDYERNKTMPSLVRFYEMVNLYGIVPETYFLGKEIIDITDYSSVGKQRAYALNKEELEKKKIKK